MLGYQSHCNVGTIGTDKNKYDKYDHDNNMEIKFGVTCKIEMKRKRKPKIDQGNKNDDINSNDIYRKAS